MTYDVDCNVTYDVDIDCNVLGNKNKQMNHNSIFLDKSSTK